MFNKVIQPILIILLQTIFLLTGCGSQSTDIPEDEKAKVITRDFRQKEELLTPASMDINWGKEVNLHEMTAMAKKGQIAEIHWYVMPNILRAQASHGDIYHIRNENKGVDLRNTLIQAGVKVGKGGILFKHFF